MRDEAKLRAVHERLKQVRASKTLKVKPCSLLRQEITGFDGLPQEFRLRYYQVIGVYHLLAMKRILLGDATGIGKTITSLGALCYLWEKEPNNKVIVIAPKSAIYQWRDEIERFTDGVKVFVSAASKGGSSGESLAARKAVYKAWQEYKGPAILILNYALLVRDWNIDGVQPLKPNGQPDPKKPVIPGVLDGATGAAAKDLVVVFDECFDYHTPVILANGSTELIGKIVCGKKPVEVLSWNFDKGQLEARRVIRWVRNPMSHNRRDSLLKLKFKYARSCRVTKSHRFYRNNGGSIRARDLKIGSETAYLNTLAPTEDQMQVILGSLLGDASVCHPKSFLWGVSFVQGAAQESYLQFKKAVLDPLGTSAISTTPSGYGGSDIYRFRVRANPSVCSRFKTHFRGRKSPSLDWLDAITPLGLAIWYGDDGSLQEHRCKTGEVTRRIILNTQGFTEEENQLLAGWLRWKWGVSSVVKPSKKGFYLYLDAAASERFLNLLPGALPGISYKFPNKMEISPEDLDTTPRQELVADEVTSISSWNRAPRKGKPVQDYVYDLEVEGNHNYFAGGTLVSNCTAFKSTRTKTWEIAKFLSARAHRVYALTATLLKNRLEEGYAIYKVIKPDLFTTRTKFLDEYCYTRLKAVGRGRKIPIIIGYKNLQGFRDVIDPFYLGRQKHEVSDELPTLTTREIRFDLKPAEDTKYGEALTGALELGDGSVRDYEHVKALVSLTYCQMVVNSLSMLKFAESDEVAQTLDFGTGEMSGQKVGALSSKEQELVDLVTGELDDEKVIVYTRFASLVPRLQALLKKEKVKSVAITGKQSDKERRKAQKAFQDLNSDTRVVFLTAAGTEAINLQAAAAMIFFDAPWSWGDYVQAVGRMVRIGSPHQKVLAYHLVSRRPKSGRRSRKTIDDYVLEILRGKKNLIDQVLGEAVVDALEFQSPQAVANQLLSAIRNEVGVYST